MAISSELKLQMKELELNALFDAIRAINNNASEEDLYRIFMFTLRTNANIGKMVLFVLDDNNWNFKTSFGTKFDYKDALLPEKFKLTEPGEFAMFDAPFLEFSRVLPVTHKGKPLAYVFIGKAAADSDDEKMDIPFVQALSNIIIVAVENKKLARKQKTQEALKRQIEIARDVQTLLFPKKLPKGAPIHIEASYKPHHSVGGDYYDFLPCGDDTFMLCVADVSGKGVPAALLMSNFQSALRALIRKTQDLEEVVKELNYLIMENSGGNYFITAFVCIYNFKTHTLHYVNAGHNAPLLFDAEGKKHSLNGGTIIIGSFNPLPFLQVGEIKNIKNFLLFCYTDGYTETENEAGEEFGEEALAEFLQTHKDMPQEELHTALIEHLNAFKGKQNYADDLTLLSCRVTLDS